MSYIRLLPSDAVRVRVRLPPPFALFDVQTLQACVVWSRLAAPFFHILAVPHSRRSIFSLQISDFTNSIHGTDFGNSHAQDSRVSCQVPGVHHSEERLITSGRARRRQNVGTLETAVTPEVSTHTGRLLSKE